MAAHILHQINRRIQRLRKRKRNVFASNFKRKALIAYLTEPFTSGLTFSHTNLRECLAAAEILSEFGFMIDVVDHYVSGGIDYSEYEVVYGMGAALELSFYSDCPNIKCRIFYATGCSPIYSSIATTLKVRDFYGRSKVFLLDSSRLVQQTQMAQVFLSDKVIVLGNDFVLDTYIRFDLERKERYCRLDAFFNDCYDIDLQGKVFESARRHFLWLGSGGLLHKGLDILLDIFVQNPNIHLHVCGAPTRERGFAKYFDTHLFHSANITNHGFVRMDSGEFRSIMDVCGYVLSPSLSEGGAPAVLNAMANGGLLPILTRESGLDIGEYGWQIEGQNLLEFSKVIEAASVIDPAILRNAATDTKAWARKRYSYELYKKSLRNILKDLLQSKGVDIAK